MPRTRTLSIFAVRLRQLRKNARMSQEQLGQAVGYSGRAAVNGWERDKQSPPLATVALLAGVLKVSPAWLAGWA